MREQWAGRWSKGCDGVPFAVDVLPAHHEQKSLFLTPKAAVTWMNSFSVYIWPGSWMVEKLSTHLQYRVEAGCAVNHKGVERGGAAPDSRLRMMLLVWSKVPHTAEKSSESMRELRDGTGPGSRG